MPSERVSLPFRAIYRAQHQRRGPISALFQCAKFELKSPNPTVHRTEVSRCEDKIQILTGFPWAYHLGKWFNLFFTA